MCFVFGLGRGSESTKQEVKKQQQNQMQDRCTSHSKKFKTHNRYVFVSFVLAKEKIHFKNDDDKTAPGCSILAILMRTGRKRLQFVVVVGR